MELLRFATAGSVDDGKSTLIGRLLFDSKSIFEDQLESVERVSRQRGDEYTDLALLTDGLRAEREQGITIDVAYRYFATPARKFIIADTPGPHPVHPQHGHGELDRRPHPRAGRRPQGHRRADPPPRLPGLAAAGAPPPAVRQQDGPRRLRQATSSTPSARSSPTSPAASSSPISRSSPSPPCRATTSCSARPTCPGTRARPCSTTSRQVYISSDRNLIDPRLPVQWVVRPKATSHHDYRGYAGRVAGGVFRPGDEVMVLPSGPHHHGGRHRLLRGRARRGVPARCR